MNPLQMMGMMSKIGEIRSRVESSERARVEARIEGRAGGGAVVVVLGGDLVLRSVKIAPAAAAAATQDATMLEDLVQAAMRDALKQWADRFGVSMEERLRKCVGDDLAQVVGGIL